MTATELLAKELSPLGWANTRLIFLSHFILSVIKTRTVNLSKLANAFENKSKSASNYKRLQRFFRWFELDIDAFTQFVAKSLPDTKWVVCVDRTNWKIGKTNVNFLVLAIAYKKIAIPLMWTLLDKKGNSNTAERIELMDRFIKLFGAERIDYLTADREFIGGKWIQYLKDKQISFRIRIKKDTIIHNQNKNTVYKITRLFNLKINETMILNKPRMIWGVSVYIGAVRTKDGFVLIISDKHTPLLTKDYLRRWEIETLFGCLKSKGFNLEDTKLCDPERLSKLFALLTITFIWCYKVGEWSNDKKPIRILTHKRLAQSLFRKGLDELNRIALNAHHMFDSFIKMVNIFFVKFSDNKNLSVV